MGATSPAFHRTTVEERRTVAGNGRLPAGIGKTPNAHQRKGRRKTPAAEGEEGKVGARKLGRINVRRQPERRTVTPTDSKARRTVATLQAKQNGRLDTEEDHPA